MARGDERINLIVALADMVGSKTVLLCTKTRQTPLCKLGSGAFQCVRGGFCARGRLGRSPGGYLERIGSPQYFFRPQSLHLNPAQTASNRFMAASTRAGSSVRIPASKFRVRVLFIPMPAPVRLADPI